MKTGPSKSDAPHVFDVDEATRKVYDVLDDLVDDSGKRVGTGVFVSHDTTTPFGSGDWGKSGGTGVFVGSDTFGSESAFSVDVDGQKAGMKMAGAGVCVGGDRHLAVNQGVKKMLMKTSQAMWLKKEGLV